MYGCVLRTAIWAFIRLIPTCALLAEDGELLIRPVDGGELTTRLHDGFLTVSNDKVTIAAKHAEIATPTTGKK